MDRASSARSIEERVSGSTIPEESRTAAEALLNRAHRSMSLAGESSLAGPLVVLDPLGVVVAHEGHVADHPGHLAGELGHGVVVHLVVHGLAVLPGLVQPAALGQGADQGAEGADDHGGALGQLGAQLHGFLGMLDGGGQLALALHAAASICRARTPRPADSAAIGCSRRCCTMSLHSCQMALLHQAFGLHVGHVPPGAGVLGLQGDLGGGGGVGGGQRVVPEVPGLPGVQAREHVFGVADRDRLAPGLQRLGRQFQPAGKLFDDIGGRLAASGFQQRNVAGGVQVPAQFRLRQAPFEPFRAELLPESVPHGYLLIPDSLCTKCLTVSVETILQCMSTRVVLTL